MITLWGRNNSTNVKKVLWTLEELDLPFNQIMAGMSFGVNKEADYLAMNPNGLVPLLRDDETDATLWESNTIVRYLAAQYGQGRLWVESPARRAQGEKWMDWANQTLSLFAFLCITAWMFENGKGKWAWIPMIPGCFYTFICVTYIANAHIGFNIPWTPAYIIGVACAIAYVVGCCVYGKKRAAKLLAK